MQNTNKANRDLEVILSLVLKYQEYKSEVSCPGYQLPLTD